MLLAWAWSRRKQVLMHAHQTGENCSPAQIQHFGFLYLGLLGPRTSIADSSRLNHNTLILGRCGSGPIDYANMVKNQSGGLFLHVGGRSPFGDGPYTMLANRVHSQKHCPNQSCQASYESNNSRGPNEDSSHTMFHSRPAGSEYEEHTTATATVKSLGSPSSICSRWRATYPKSADNAN